MNKKQIDELARALLWTGGLNIGIIGLFNYNVLVNVFGVWPNVLTIIYVAIGAAAVYSIAKNKV